MQTTASDDMGPTESSHVDPCAAGARIPVLLADMLAVA